MFSSLLSKTSKKPVTMVRIEPSNSKSDDSECYQHLRTLRSKLHDFNSTLKKSFIFVVCSLFNDMPGWRNW